MQTLYPPSIQFHCGAVTAAALFTAGILGWNHEWGWMAAMLSIALAGLISSAVIATREG